MLASHIASRLRASRQVARFAHSPAIASHEADEKSTRFSPRQRPQDAFVHTEDDSNQATIVRDVRTAARAVTKLMNLPPQSVVAWDTETTGVNPAKESPVGKGSVICATAFAGDEIDFGSGPRLFIDCYSGNGGTEVLNVFKGYFENKQRKKVWHNYAFDRHMLMNHGITVNGFGGDTIHMARLLDSSRQKYSLQDLCRAYVDVGSGKRNMSERFGRKEILKNGSEGKKIVVPDTIELMTSMEFRENWIDYATADAELTYRLYNRLKSQLEGEHIEESNESASVGRLENLYELYKSLFIPFGEVLIDMERTGFKVDVDWLKRAEAKADSDRLALEDKFREWAQSRSKDARYMNLNSDSQKQQLFFAPYVDQKTGVKLPKEETFCIKPAEFLPERYVAEILESQQSGDTKNRATKGAQAIDPRKKLKKEITLVGLGKKVVETTATGLPSVAGPVLRKLAGNPRANPPQYGDPSDSEMCLAIDDLISATSISTMISTFIRPLQEWPRGDGRIHASLNLNTETGRLSSRRPNLQNQPALEKDRYQVRNAFVPEKGNSLIVADYAQLELRLLAHITNCKSMIEAFEAGGDFHSRTAMTMFDDVAKAVERGDCLLESGVGSTGDKSPPLLKDMFSVERRKAKTLNFSIAYGKTVKGLAKDWGVSQQEAEKTRDLWYKDRQEVLEWQNECKKFLSQKRYVQTILGRRRHLPDIDSERFGVRRHAERAAINAPLQGSAADLVMSAMVKLHENRVLSALGWKIVLQVHDEIILEGPTESAEIALPIVVEQMKNPIDCPLRVDLTVDAKHVTSWYEAK